MICRPSTLIGTCRVLEAPSRAPCSSGRSPPRLTRVPGPERELCCTAPHHMPHRRPGDVTPPRLGNTAGHGEAQAAPRTPDRRGGVPRLKREGAGGLNLPSPRPASLSADPTRTRRGAARSEVARRLGLHVRPLTSCSWPSFRRGAAGWEVEEVGGGGPPPRPLLLRCCLPDPATERRRRPMARGGHAAPCRPFPSRSARGARVGYAAMVTSCGVAARCFSRSRRAEQWQLGVPPSVRALLPVLARVTATSRHYLALLFMPVEPLAIIELSLATPRRHRRAAQ